MQAWFWRILLFPLQWFLPSLLLMQAHTRVLSNTLLLFVIIMYVLLLNSRLLSQFHVLFC